MDELNAYVKTLQESEKSHSYKMRMIVLGGSVFLIFTGLLVKFCQFDADRLCNEANDFHTQTLMQTRHEPAKRS